MNNLENDEILNVNILKSKYFLYSSSNNRFFVLLLKRMQLLGILKETAEKVAAHGFFPDRIFAVKNLTETPI